MKCSYIFVSNKCFDVISGQRQKSSQDKSRNEEEALLSADWRPDKAETFTHTNYHLKVQHMCGRVEGVHLESVSS